MRTGVKVLLDNSTNMNTAPTINFNGAFLVNSLETGSVLIGSQRVFAVKVLFHQTLNYPILAAGELVAEVRAYCVCAQQKGLNRLEAYAPCCLARDLQSGGLVSVASRITWYAPALDPSCMVQTQTAWQPGNGATFAVFGGEV